MSALTWAALAFLLLVITLGAVVLTYLGIAAWRGVRALRRGSLAAALELTEGVTALEERVATLEQRAAELQGAIERLSLSLQRARALAAVAQEVRDAARAVRAFVPQK